MSVVIFQSPNKKIKSSGTPATNYADIDFNYDKVKMIISLITKLEEKCNQYNEFQRNIPVSIRFNKLLPKSLRIKSMFKLGKKIKQI
jgi:hypothetical protein